jgi:hypothetical protein
VLQALNSLSPFLSLVCGTRPRILKYRYQFLECLSVPFDMSSPAHYRRRSALAGPQRSDLELPPYSSTLAPQPSGCRDRVEHIYQLGSSKNKPWATLKLFSSANSPKQLPTFFQGEQIIGSVEMSLEKGDNLRSVSVSVSVPSVISRTQLQ